MEAYQLNVIMSENDIVTVVSQLPFIPRTGDIIIYKHERFDAVKVKTALINSITKTVKIICEPIYEFDHGRISYDIKWYKSYFDEWIQV